MGNGGDGGRYTVASLFAGIGGFCTAFDQAGFKVVWANEIDPHAAKTYRHNYPDVKLYEKSIRDLTVIGDELLSVDVITAGFPCQPFSVAGNKAGFSDPRGSLFFEIIRLLKEFGNAKPKIVLLENVAHLLNHEKGRTFTRIIDSLQEAGYWFTESTAHVLDTSVHTEIPQIRQRLFMAALDCNSFSYNSFNFPGPVSQDLRRDYREYLDTHLQQSEWHYFDPESRWGKLFYKAIENGDNAAPYQLRRSYVRELKNGLIPTLMANMGEGGHNQPVIKDNWGVRKFTVLECLRFQGFDPRTFEFPADCTLYQAYKQVGNSVTVPLVKLLAMECFRLLKTLEENESKRSIA